MAKLEQLSIKELQKREFTLVLSGGSAFGLAHIGVLKFLDEHSIKPTEVIGTSMGAIIAAFYAMGKKHSEVYEIMSSVNFLKLIKLNLLGNSLLSHDAIRSHLRHFFGEISIGMLPTPLKIASTCARSGDPKIFDRNSSEKLIDILCTSFSIPAIFPPFELNNTSYYDGFLSSNLPIDVASEKLVLAINVLNRSQLETFSSPSLHNVLKKSFIISILNQNRLTYTIAEKKKIFTVEPNLTGFDFTDFNKVDALSQCGEEAIHSAIQP